MAILLQSITPAHLQEYRQKGCLSMRVCNPQDSKVLDLDQLRPVEYPFGFSATNDGVVSVYTHRGMSRALEQGVDVKSLRMFEAPRHLQSLRPEKLAVATSSFESASLVSAEDVWRWYAKLGLENFCVARSYFR